MDSRELQNLRKWNVKLYEAGEKLYQATLMDMPHKLVALANARGGWEVLKKEMPDLNIEFGDKNE